MMNDPYQTNPYPNEQAGNPVHGQTVPGVVMGESFSRILWRGRWLILFALILAGAGVWFYLRNVTPMYESAAQILVDKPSPQPRSDVPQPVGSTLGQLPRHAGEHDGQSRDRVGGSEGPERGGPAHLRRSQLCEGTGRRALGGGEQEGRCHRGPGVLSAC